MNLPDYMKEPMFFYTVAFAIFAVLAFIYGRKPMAGWIDGEISKISTELEQARALRKEAEAALADYKAKQQAAMAEADSIIRSAQSEASRLREQAVVDLKNALARYERQAAERIKLAETEALEAVRRVAVDRAVKIASETLAANLKTGQSDHLIEQALEELPQLSAKTAKAA